MLDVETDCAWFGVSEFRVRLRLVALGGLCSKLRKAGGSRRVVLMHCRCGLCDEGSGRGVDLGCRDRGLHEAESSWDLVLSRWHGGWPKRGDVVFGGHHSGLREAGSRRHVALDARQRGQSSIVFGEHEEGSSCSIVFDESCLGLHGFRISRRRRDGLRGCSETNG